MNELSPRDKMFLNAAEGWLGLGDHLAANEELENITPALLDHPDVLEVRLEIYFEAEKWDACVDIANSLVKLKPGNSFGWIRRSFALHELMRTGEAYDLLLPINDKFPKCWTIPYNLACYCAQLNRLEEAQVWIKKAMKIDEVTVKHEAINDPDLKPLWDSMSGKMWKKE